MGSPEVSDDRKKYFYWEVRTNPKHVCGNKLCRNISSTISCRKNSMFFFFLAKHQEISRTKNFPVLMRSWNKTWCFNKTKAQLLDGTWLQTADVSDGKLLAVTELRYVQRSPDVLSDRWYSVSTYPRFAETYMANIYSGDRVGNTLLKTLTSDCVMICNLKW